MLGATLSVHELGWEQGVKSWTSRDSEKTYQGNETLMNAWRSKCLGVWSNLTIKAWEHYKWIGSLFSIHQNSYVVEIFLTQTSWLLLEVCSAEKSINFYFTDSNSILLKIHPDQWWQENMLHGGWTWHPRYSQYTLRRNRTYACQHNIQVYWGTISCPEAEGFNDIYTKISCNN